MKRLKRLVEAALISSLSLLTHAVFMRLGPIQRLTLIPSFFLLTPRRNQSVRAPSAVSSPASARRPHCEQRILEPQESQQSDINPPSLSSPGVEAVS